MRDRPTHRGLRPQLYSNSGWILYRPTGFTCSRVVRRAYSLSSLSEKTRKSNRLQMYLQTEHFLLSYFKTLSKVLVRPEFELTASRSAGRRLSNWAKWAAVYLLIGFKFFFFFQRKLGPVSCNPWDWEGDMLFASFAVAQVRLCFSLRPRRNLISVSNVCEAAPRFLSYVPNELDELLEMRLEFLFNLISKLIMAFLTGQS